MVTKLLEKIKSWFKCYSCYEHDYKFIKEMCTECEEHLIHTKYIQICTKCGYRVGCIDDIEQRLSEDL